MLPIPSKRNPNPTNIFEEKSKLLFSTKMKEEFLRSRIIQTNFLGKKLKSETLHNLAKARKGVKNEMLGI